MYLEGQSTYRFQIPEDTKRQETFNYRVKLPDGVTCSRCVLQWIYFTGQFSSYQQVLLHILIFEFQVTRGTYVETEQEQLVAETKRLLETAQMWLSSQIREALGPQALFQRLQQLFTTIHTQLDW